MFGEERHYSAEDGTAFDLAFVVLCHQTRSDFDLVAEFEDSGDDASTCYATLQVFDFGTRFVDVEGADHNHVWCGGEVSGRDWYSSDEVFVDGIDVVLELCGDGDDGRAICDRSPDEFQDRLVVLFGAFFPHQVDLVLQNDDVVKLHDFNSCEMLGRLWLWAGFVARNEEEGGVHDGRAR